MGLLKKVFKGVSAAIPAFAVSTGQFGKAAQGLQTGLNIATGLAGAGVLRGSLGAALAPQVMGSPHAFTTMPVAAPAVVGRQAGVGGTFLSNLLPPASGRPSSGLFGTATNRTLVQQELAEWGVRLGLQKGDGSPRALRRKEFTLLVNRFGFSATANLLNETDERIVWAWFVLRRRRRQTGISARDIRRVRRAQATVRKARKIASAFGRITGGGGRRRGSRNGGAGTRIVKVE